MPPTRRASIPLVIGLFAFTSLAGCLYPDEDDAQDGVAGLPYVYAMSSEILPDTARARLALEEADAWLLEAKFDSVWPRIVLAESLFASSGEPASILRASLVKGRYLLELGRATESRSVVEQALDAADRSEATPDAQRATALDLLGMSSRLLGAFEEARRYHQEALDIRLQRYGPHHSEIAQSYHFLGTVEQALGNVQRAEAYYRQRIALSPLLTRADSISYAKTLNNLALARSSQGDRDQGRAYHADVLAMRTRMLPYYHNDVASSYHNIGNEYIAISDYEHALESFQRALAIRHRLFGAKHIDIAGGYYSIGRVYNSLGWYDLALEYYDQAERAMDLEKYVRHPLRFLLDVRRATVLKNRGAYRASFDLIVRSMENIRQQYGEVNRHMAEVYRLMGAYYERETDYGQAEAYYEKYRAIASRIYGTRHPAAVEALFNQAAIAMKTERYDEALGLFEEGIGILEDLGLERPVRAQAYNDVAQIYITTGNRQKALGAFQKAFEVNLDGYTSTDVLDFPDAQTYTAFSSRRFFETLTQKAGYLGTVYHDTRDTSYLIAASAAYRQAGALVRNDLLEHPTEASMLTWVEQTHQMYEPAIAASLALHAATGDASFREAAFDFAEQSRGLVLTSSIMATRARTFGGVPDTLLRKEEDIRLRLTYYAQSLAEEQARGDAADSARVGLWQGKVFALKRAHDALLERFEAEYPDYYRLKHHAASASVADVQTQLAGSNDALVEYLVGQDSLYTFVITPASFDVVAAAIDSTAADDVTALRRAIVSHDRGAYLEKGRALYDRLIAPVEPIVAGKHLVIVPDAYLSQLPFEALLTTSVDTTVGYGDLPYLIESHSISYAYSATLYIQTRAERVSPRKDFVGYAPVFSNGLLDGSRGALLLGDRAAPVEVNRGFLPATFDEVKSIEQLFVQDRGVLRYLFGAKTDVYLEDEATEATIRDALRDHRFVHLATHAFVNADDPLRSGIVLQADTTGGYDGVLELAEIYNLQLDAELVTLSACETGLGRQIRGEGLIGLTRGFLYAGAQNVLVSLWNVQDAATARLMTQFYSRVLDEAPLSAALRDAKRGLIQSKGRLADPYYWSAFVLNGR
ncbi:MAG: CHAT domain-containing tetratricopeptide repeat protein [Rhodothermales bacterium]